MKTHMNKFLLCLFGVAAVACSKEEVTTPAATKGYPLSFGAGTTVLDELESRAGYDGVKSIWHAGDALGVSFGVGNNNLQFTQDAGSLSGDATSATYSGTLNSPITGTVTATAYFPYSASASVSGTTITTTFPSTQTYFAGGYKGMPLFAKYTGDIAALKFQFKNAFSILRIPLSKSASISGAVNLRKIVFQGNNNETVSGAIAVNMSGATPVVSYTGAGKTITLDCGSGVVLTTTDQYFYIAVPAINYTKGYSLTFFTDQGQQTKSAKATGANYVANMVYKTTPLALDKLSQVSVILDVNLRNALKGLGLITIIDNVTGVVGITAAGLLATSIDVSGKDITVLAGIENFPALLSLDVSGNDLTSIDLSKNLLLTTVKCYGNELVTLNISGLKALVTLNLINGLNSINLSKLTIPAAAKIENLIADGTVLSSWTSFSCMGNPHIKTISLKNCIGMLQVTATNNNQLTSLNVTGSGLTSLGVTTSGNASGFTVTGLVL